MHRFLCPELNTSVVELPADEAHHAVHVLRLRTGDRIALVDGKGSYAEADLTHADKRGCTAELISRRHHNNPAAGIHIAVAPTKSIDRFEWFLEKATELGVERITPLITQRTERGHLRHDRLLKVLVSAMKQSQRSWLPQLDPATELKALLPALAPQCYFGWCEGEHADFAGRYDATRPVSILIGPEGDLSAEEAELLRTHGAEAVALGSARLRTETAAVAALAWTALLPR